MDQTKYLLTQDNHIMALRNIALYTMGHIQTTNTGIQSSTRCLYCCVSDRRWDHLSTQLFEKHHGLLPFWMVLETSEDQVWPRSCEKNQECLCQYKSMVLKFPQQASVNFIPLKLCITYLHTREIMLTPTQRAIKCQT
jgi:hypothetical protein